MAILAIHLIILNNVFIFILYSCLTILNLGLISKPLCSALLKCSVFGNMRYKTFTTRTHSLALLTRFHETAQIRVMDSGPHVIQMSWEEPVHQ